MRKVVIFCLILIFMLPGIVNGQSATNLNEYNLMEINNFIAKNPNDADAYNVRGLIYYDKRQYNDAINDFSKAIMISPNKTQFYNNRAIVYSVQGKYQQAIADLDKSKDINPNDVNTYFSQAKFYIKINRYKEAVDTYYEIVGRMPTDRKNVEKARELVKATGYLPYNLSAIEIKQNAKLFNKIMETPIWVEKTVKVWGGDIEKAKKFAMLSARIEAGNRFVDKISLNTTLRIPRYSVGFYNNMEIVQEDTNKKYGKVVGNNTGTEDEKITFRFLIKCQKVGEINPFVKKQIYNKSAILKEFKDFDEYWEIVVSGHGFYEGFEDIDYKSSVASQRGVDSACKEIINKITELGVTDESTQNQIINIIKSKRNYGGICYIWGCGVEIDARIPIRLYKKDYSIKFIYN